MLKHFFTNQTVEVVGIETFKLKTVANLSQFDREHNYQEQTDISLQINNNIELNKSRMHQQSINIKPRVHRQNSTQNPIVSSPSYQSTNNSYLKPPTPTDYLNRPPTYHHRGSVQLNAPLIQSKVQNSNSPIKLDSYARVILPKQESLRTSLNGQPSVYRSSQKAPMMLHKGFSNISPNSNQKPQFQNSKLTSNVHRSSTSVLLAPQRKVSKRLSQFFQSKAEQRQQIPSICFNQNTHEDSYESSRVNKTDRQGYKKTAMPPKSFLKSKTQTKSSEASQETPKVNIISLNSTAYSEANMNPPEKAGFPTSQSISQQLSKKGFSPTNPWPLSISPSQTKYQKNTLDPCCQGRIDRKLSEHHDQSMEFKKKKNFEFFNKLQRRSSFKSDPRPQKPERVVKIEDFQLLQKVGKGAFGDVFTAEQKATKFMCIIKRLLKKTIKEKSLEEHLIRQIKIQSYLDHRHLTPLYGFFADQKYIYLILEYMQDGSLMQVNKKRKLGQSQVSHYVRQICLGLKYMHTENIIHRDIKPQNIFLNENYAKIGDFGCSVYTRTNRETQIGSFAYVSPEQLKLQSYNEKIDVWSVGVMAYEMLIGKSPFEQDIIQIAKQQKAPGELSQLVFPEYCDLSFDAKDFLTKMLTFDPVERLGIDEALRHEFVLKYIRHEQPVLMGSQVSTTHE